MSAKSKKPSRGSRHPIRRGPRAPKRKAAPTPSPKPLVAPPAPPGPADVWLWLRVGMLDGLIFLAASLFGSIITMRTQNPWIFLLGLVVAVVLSSVRRLPVRPLPVKAGYFSGMAGLFSVGMLGMLLVMPRPAWVGIWLFSAVMALICAGALWIGLRAVRSAPKGEDLEG